MATTHGLAASETKTRRMKKRIPILLLALWALGCAEVQQNWTKKEEFQGQIATFLTFQKEDAEQAMNFYMGLFENSKIVEIKRWGKEGPGKEGTLMHATFTLNGKLLMCSDSPPVHAWDFSPAISLYVDCRDATQLERLFSQLSENGQVLMPLGNYGFSQQFAFVEDQFGISWQLNLP